MQVTIWGDKCGNFKNDSVVNLNLSLHEEKDIFICGGAIFPFSGVAILLCHMLHYQYGLLKTN